MNFPNATLLEEVARQIVADPESVFACLSAARQTSQKSGGENALLYPIVKFTALYLKSQDKKLLKY